MHEFVFFNQEIMSADTSFLPAFSSATIYGKSIFTTVAIYNSTPFRWENHWQRLNTNAEKIGIDLSEFDERFVKNSLSEIIQKNKLIKARARITFFDESVNKIWQTASKRQTGFLIVSAAPRPETSEISLGASPFRTTSFSPLAGVKSGNYLENILALEDAKAKGFDEAIRCNERGEVVSATMANVFWTKRSVIFTPNVETGCLAGTTRSFVLENFAVEETNALLAEIENADEIFLTSAGIEIANVLRFNGKTFAGKIVNQIQAEFSRQCTS
jgi:branched-subunit amino acid aminotransferase/4-amino-4-deoxychorismate lyase